MATADEGGRKVLVAYDGSDASKEAFEFALSSGFVRLDKDSVIVLHVQYPGWELYESPDSLHAAYSRQDQKAAAEKSLAEGFQKLIETNEPLKAITRFESKEGDARHVIVKTAEEEKVNLVVIGSHGKGLLKRLALGSVSDYVANHASAPVLVYRSPNVKH